MLSTTFSPPYEPKPVDAQYVVGIPTYVWVSFDVPIVDAVLDPGNWEVWWQGGNRVVLAAVATLGLVRLHVQVGAPVNTRSDVTFTPPPFDVASAAGGTAPAFAAFPLHA